MLSIIKMTSKLETNPSLSAECISQMKTCVIKKQLLIPENSSDVLPEWVIEKRDLALVKTWIEPKAKDYYAKTSKQIPTKQTTETRLAAFRKLFSA